ncbi:MAG: hypothetical protein FWF28_07680 [Micrococcales bacterium]|nr:hypothetical protein [Micrococcales bacterium]
MLTRMITLYLHCTVASGRRGDLERFLAEARTVYEAPGGIRARLQWDLTDPGRFVEIFEYADRDIYERDQERVETDPEMASLLTRWHTLLAEGPAVSAYQEVMLPVHP